MRALDPEVMDAMWAAAEPRLPVGGGDHPLGCHRPRISDRVCFEGIVIRLLTGCSWVTAERLLGGAVSDTTLRARRDEWIAAGVFDELAAEALGADSPTVWCGRRRRCAWLWNHVVARRSRSTRRRRRV